MEIYILSNKNILSNENIFLSNENNFYRMQMFLSNQNNFDQILLHFGNHKGMLSPDAIKDYFKLVLSLKAASFGDNNTSLMHVK